MIGRERGEFSSLHQREAWDLKKLRGERPQLLPPNKRVGMDDGRRRQMDGSPSLRTAIFPRGNRPMDRGGGGGEAGGGRVAAAGPVPRTGGPEELRGAAIQGLLRMHWLKPAIGPLKQEGHLTHANQNGSLHLTDGLLFSLP